MDPVSLGVMAVGSAAVGTATSLMGASKQAEGNRLQGLAALQQGEAAAQGYLYQSAIALRNRDIAKQNADYSLWAGETEAQKSGLKTKFELGRQMSQQGASGLDVNFGSNVQVRDSTHEIGWQDQRVIRSEAAKRAYAFNYEADTLSVQSDMYKRAADDSRRAGAIGYQAGSIAATSSILGGISSVASKWMQASTFIGGGGRSTLSYGSGGAASP